ncbi:MAG: S8 family serine peptidase [Desulfobulbaceae bacterium]|nr:S8 family serine peptidase [Desulfobulbaceae bacterium]
MNIVFKGVFGALILVSTIFTGLFSVQAQSVPLGFEVHPKLNDPARIFAGFRDNKTTTNIIINIKPTQSAKELANKFRQRKDIPAQFRRAGAPTYYDLENKEIKQELRKIVTGKVNRMAAQLSSADIIIKRKFSYQFGFAAEVTEKGLEQLLDLPEVILIEEDRVLLPHLSQGGSLINGITTRSTYDGSGISIAICDTGIDTAHPRLGNDNTGIFNSKVIGGYDTGDNDGDPRPLAGGNAHGTACGAIAAGDLGTVGDYIGGVAPGAKLYAIKISSGIDGSATSSAMIAGWEWCLTHQNDDPSNPIMIISTSFGGGRYTSFCDTASASMTTAAANAVAGGITLFVSSGNDGYCDSMGWPACISYVNSVGAVYDSAFGSYNPCVNASSCASKTATGGCPTGYYATDSTAADMVTSYSNSASFLTMFAPANQAYTADITGADGYSTGDYTDSFGGTSAACPYAAGAAAVLQQAAKINKGSYLSPSEVKNYLVYYGNSLTDSKVTITKPRINIGAAINGLSLPPPSFYPVHLIMAPILAAASNSYWGVTTGVCCENSSVIFTLNNDSLSKSTSITGCTGTPTSQGYAVTKFGLKYFTWTLTSPACGNYTGSFSYTLEKRRKYIFYPDVDVDGMPVIWVMVSSNQSTSVVNDTVSITNNFVTDDTTQVTYPINNLESITPTLPDDE